MRQARGFGVFIVVVLVALAWATTAGADRPDKEPAPSQDVHGVTGICSFPISWTFTAHLDGTGHWLVGDFPDDSPPSSLLLYSGHIRIDISPEGQLTLVSYVGAAPIDVCALVS